MSEEVCPTCHGTGKVGGRLALPGECEVVTARRGGQITGQCCAPATWHYAAMGGGYMHLCEAHSLPHRNISERIPAEAHHA